MSSLSVEQNDNIFQILPADKFHHEDTACRRFTRKEKKKRIRMGQAEIEEK